MSMEILVRLVCGCYSVLLICYPQRLRSEYGLEMVETLREELLNGQGSRARVAARAVWELFAIGIPSRLSGERCAVMPMAIGVSLAAWYAFLSVLHDSSGLDAFMRRCLGVHCP